MKQTLTKGWMPVMDIEITKADVTYTPEDGYIGKVEFQVLGHRSPYEITLYSKKAKDWSYSLHYAGESGPEEEILSVEERIEEDDDLFERLIQAIESKI